jgi:hypothetical protein
MASKRSLKNNLAEKDGDSESSGNDDPNSSDDPNTSDDPISPDVILICQGKEIKVNRLKLAGISGIVLPLHEGQSTC